MMYCTSSVLALQHLRLKFDRCTPLLFKQLCQTGKQLSADMQQALGPHLPGALMAFSAVR